MKIKISCIKSLLGEEKYQRVEVEVETDEMCDCFDPEEDEYMPWEV